MDQIVHGIANWIHLLSTVIWIGGMVYTFLVLMPAGMQVLESPVFGKLQGAIMARFKKLIYLAIVLLGVSGYLMMINNPEYNGFMKFDNTWAKLSLVKHILWAYLFFAAVYGFEVVGPKMQKMAAGGPTPELAKIQKMQKVMGMLAFACANGILLLTAFMTTFK